MESIQLAQMLADLSDLNASQDSQAAVALVSANKSLAPPAPPSTPTDTDAKPPLDQHLSVGQPVRPGQRSHQRVSSSSSIISRTASPAKFDKFGRRLLTPPITRTHSAQSSLPGTPLRDAESSEDDVDRANSLMALYEIRAKLKQQDSSSLLKVREKIAALQARQQQHGEKNDGMDGRQSRFTYPKTAT
ncbi:hypothetical protein QBC46DRAFT_82588 [Diplogelasinospora grovesii]|uniref:Uncharacterized protein n=1 Tax=Diplogelasinospora grovesii TaxID=303347 RepID=A0AAN6S6U4_9PEZI|nr:hypothetical protein QBC46DRAFT_82588 [Diplogelasinospora grovesii]